MTLNSVSPRHRKVHWRREKIIFKVTPDKVPHYLANRNVERNIMTTASIVTYNTDLFELTTLIRCLVENELKRIYVVDNSPADNLRRIASISPKIEYIHGHGNIGYGSAHNMAIRKAIECKADYHTVINPDISFDNDLIATLSNYMNANPGIGQVMPRIVYPDGSLQYLCKLLPSPMDLIGRRFLPFKRYVENRNYRFEMRGSNYNNEMMVPFLSGCFMFLRVEALEKTGGFDDDFFMYCEDADLCRRIGMAGFKTVYYPKATVVHAHGKESYKNIALLITHVKSAVHYFNKWGWIFDGYRKKINKLARRQYE